MLKYKHMSTNIMRKIIFAILIFVFFVSVYGCAKKESTGIANPASEYCVKNGGKLKIVDDEKGQHGICTLPSGKECEEWAYFRKECN